MASNWIAEARASLAAETRGRRRENLLWAVLWSVTFPLVSVTWRLLAGEAVDSFWHPVLAVPGFALLGWWRWRRGCREIAESVAFQERYLDRAEAWARNAGE